MNNESKKPEKLQPQDSDQKKIKHPEDDQKAVIKPEDEVYNKQDATFINPAKEREQREQPVHPVKKAPKG